MNKRILVIDDEEAIRKSFTLALEDTEYQVDTAVSGEIGIDMVSKSGYDLIFLDLKMPGLNGVETLRVIRRIDSNTPVYIITAFIDEFVDSLRQAEEEGLNFEVLKKPVGTDEIILLTKGVLDGPISFETSGG